MAFATTNTASASAALAWIFFDWMRGHKPSALGACVGAVVGLVAITPAAGYVGDRREHLHRHLSPASSRNLMVHWKNASTLDDTLDVFPCHGVGGMVGMLMTGIFAKDVGLTSGHADDVPRALRRAGVRRRVLVLRLVDPLQVHRLDHPAARVRGAGRDRPRSQPARRSDAGRDGGSVAAADVREDSLKKNSRTALSLQMYAIRLDARGDSAHRLSRRRPDRRSSVDAAGQTGVPAGAAGAR